MQKENVRKNLVVRASNTTFKENGLDKDSKTTRNTRICVRKESGGLGGAALGSGGTGRLVGAGMAQFGVQQVHKTI